MLGPELAERDLGDLLDLVRGAALPAVGAAAAEHEHDRRTEVRGDARVEGELGRGADVGVVAADDEHRVAAVRHRAEPLDDGAERGLGVVVHGGVGGADRLLRARPSAVARASSRSST